MTCSYQDQQLIFTLPELRPGDWWTSPLIKLRRREERLCLLMSVRHRLGDDILWWESWFACHRVCTELMKVSVACRVRPYPAPSLPSEMSLPRWASPPSLLTTPATGRREKQDSYCLNSTILTAKIKTKRIQSSQRPCLLLLNSYN